MLDGTVKYLGEVLTRYRDGLRPESIVNEPMNPRVPLRESPQEGVFLATKHLIDGLSGPTCESRLVRSGQ